MLGKNAITFLPFNKEQKISELRLSTSYSITYSLVLAIVIYAIAKDEVLHKKYDKGNFYILLGFLVFVLILFLMKIFLSHECTIEFFFNATNALMLFF
jgi:hypothetical protein